jgi:ABC-2 type transport system permease protein
MFRGLVGEPIDIGRLAAFLSWRTINFGAIILGAWSIVAMSGTLAGEAARGSLDLVLTTPVSRRSAALQKGGAHITSVVIATTVIGLATWLAATVFATLPGDEASAGATFAHMVWLALMMMFPATIAWFLAPVLGRGAAAGIGAFVMIASYVVHGYRESVPAFESLDSLSYFGFTAGHRPLAGVSDWPSVGVLAGITLLVFWLGVLVFERRDVGIVANVGLPMPRIGIGLGGPFARSLGEQLPAAIWTGLALGSFGFVVALNADSFIGMLQAVPQIVALINRFMPGVDLLSAGGVLQLMFFEIGTLFVIALAGVVAGGWASDEQEKRLELVLAAPMSRTRWALASGSGVFAAVAAFAVVSGIVVSLGTVVAKGDDPLSPIGGMLSLGIYAALLVGVGIAVGGCVRPGLAATAASGLGLTFYLFQLLGGALGLPQWILDLAPTRHLGQPMAGVFDVPGTAVVAAIAVGGLVFGAAGLSRRDVGR